MAKTLMSEVNERVDLLKAGRQGIVNRDLAVLLDVADGRIGRMLHGEMSIEYLERLLALLGFEGIDWQGGSTITNQDFVSVRTVIKEQAAAKKRAKAGGSQDKETA